MNSSTESEAWPRIAVVVRPDELADTPYNAFAVRYHFFLRTLCSFARVSVILITGSAIPEHLQHHLLALGVDQISAINMNARINTRYARLRDMLASIMRVANDTDKVFPLQLQQSSADCAVSFTPWFDNELRSLFKSVSTIFFYEEDLRRMPENSPQSLKARLFRYLEDFAHSLERSQPAAVVSISRKEARTAKRRYPRSLHLCLPLTLDPADWPLASCPTEGAHIIVVGNFTEQRNAAGLKAFLDEFAKRSPSNRLPVRIVSGAGLHNQLLPFLSFGWVEHVVDPQSMSSEYRSALLALVPALRVTGTKATVLQAWTNACPVVCTKAVGATVSDRTAVAIGRNAKDLVDHVLYLANRPEERRQLAMAGLSAVSKCHDPAKTEDIFKQLCLQFLP